MPRDYLQEFKTIPEEKRIAEAKRIRRKYPDRCCVIVTRALRGTAPEIDRHKYLVPGDLTVGQFIYVVRRRIKVHSEKAIFMFVGNTLPPTSGLMADLYQEKKDADGFLYLTYDSENTFG